jgi:hypothetical protein
MSCGWNTNQGLNIAIVVTTINWSDAYHAKVSNEDFGRLFREFIEYAMVVFDPKKT